MRLFDDFRNLGAVDRPALASRIFGRERVENAVLEVVAQIPFLGLRSHRGERSAVDTVYFFSLANGSPNLSDLLVDRSASATREEPHDVPEPVVQASLFCQKR